SARRDRCMHRSIRPIVHRPVKPAEPDADGSQMAGCTHGMESEWCYLCGVDDFGVDPQILWGIALDDRLSDLRSHPGPMTPDVAGYLRFLCEEMGLHFDPTFTQRQAAIVIDSFLL